MKLKLVYTGRIINMKLKFIYIQGRSETWNYSKYIQGVSENMNLKLGYTGRIINHKTIVSMYREDQKIWK